MSLDLMLHWIYFNIYIQSYKTVRKKNEELYKEYKLTQNYIKRVVKPTGIDLINLSECRTDLFDIKVFDIILAQKRKEAEHERHIKLSEKIKNDIKLFERTAVI